MNTEIKFILYKWHNFTFKITQNDIKTTHCFLYQPNYRKVLQQALQDQGKHMHIQCVYRVGSPCVQGQTWHHPSDKMPNLWSSIQSCSLPLETWEKIKSEWCMENHSFPTFLNIWRLDEWKMVEPIWLCAAPFQKSKWIRKGRVHTLASHYFSKIQLDESERISYCCVFPKNSIFAVLLYKITMHSFSSN